MSALLVAVAVVVGLLMVGLVERVLRSRLRGLRDPERIKAIRPIHRPLRLLAPLVLVMLVLPFLRFHPKVLDVLQHIGLLLLIGLAAWLLLSGMRVIREWMLLRYRAEGEDESGPSRRFLTQFKTLQNIINVIVVVLAVSAALMTFKSVRQVGVGLLASAGVTGIIVGFAAQRTIATLLAGIQIAVTQPIRLNDNVTVEGEYGTIEDIALTFVVVRLWDRRSLILPITYFIEKPFLNFSRGGTQVVGSVYLYLDYAIPVEALRTELHRLVRTTPLWDGQKTELLVTKTTERAIELRATATASDPDQAFDLRCYLREHLVAFVAQRYPWALPLDRVEAHDLGRSADSPLFRPSRKD